MASELLEAYNKDHGSTLERTQSKIIENFSEKHKELKRLVKEKQEAEKELDALTQSEWWKEGVSYENLERENGLRFVVSANTELIEKLILEL